MLPKIFTQKALSLQSKDCIDMHNDDINIAIAEYCGWHPHPDNDKREQKFWTLGGTGYGLPNGVAKPVAAIPYIFDDIRGDIGGLPNYCNDLNAMHEAEKFLEGGYNWNKYTDILGKLCHYKPNIHNLRSFANIIVSASAKQRAEAFLKTIGKWEE